MAQGSRIASKISSSPTGHTCLHMSIRHPLALTLHLGHSLPLPRLHLKINLTVGVAEQHTHCAPITRNEDNGPLAKTLPPTVGAQALSGSSDRPRARSVVIVAAVLPEVLLVHDIAWVSIFDPQRQKPCHWNRRTRPFQLKCLPGVRARWVQGLSGCYIDDITYEEYAHLPDLSS